MSKRSKYLISAAVGAALAAGAMGVFTGGANAVIIADLGINPTSAAGDFSNSVGGGVFSDQFTFQLVGGPQFITTASVTNVFPGGQGSTDFITNFVAAVFSTGGDGVPGGGDDVAVIGPAAATMGCGPIVNCQSAAGTAILNPGNFFLQFTGTGGGTSGYGGNLSTFVVPSPIVGAGLSGLVIACGGLLALARRRRRQQVAA
jgi:hypothetical protein